MPQPQKSPSDDIKKVTACGMYKYHLAMLPCTAVLLKKLQELNYKCGNLESNLSHTRSMSIIQSFTAISKFCIRTNKTVSIK